MAPIYVTDSNKIVLLFPGENRIFCYVRSNVAALSMWAESTFIFHLWLKIKIKHLISKGIQNRIVVLTILTNISSTKNSFLQVKIALSLLIRNGKLKTCYCRFLWRHLIKINNVEFLHITIKGYLHWLTFPCK